MRFHWLAAGVAAAALMAGCGATTAGPAHPSFPTGNPIRGAKLFASTCAACHGPQAQGTPGLAPNLTAKSLTTLYTAEWELSEFIYQYMPKTSPGSLTRQQASDLGAFLWGLNGKLGVATRNKLYTLIGLAIPPSSSSSPSPSTSSSSPSSSSPPSSAAPSVSTAVGQFMKVNAAAKTVTLTLVASSTGANSGLNYDGYANGKLVVTVPTGWTVDVNLSNKGPLPHSAAIVKNSTATSPAFPGAGLPGSELTSGIAAGQSASFSFKTGSAGQYRIACLVVGHEALGMWDTFIVSSSGSPSIKA